MTVSLDRKKVAVATFLTIPISGASIDIYAPSLPTIADFFHIGVSSAQLSITIYLLGFGLCQLISGNLSDCFGRKHIAFVGAIAFLVTSIIAATAPSYSVLLVARLLQGLAVGMLTVPMRAAIADVYKGKEFYKMANYITIAWSVGPIVAPALGGWLQELLGWRANFFFLSFYSVVILVALWFMPETLAVSAEQKKFTLKRVISSWWLVLSHPEYIIGLLSLGLLYLSAVLFNVVGSFFVENSLGYSPHFFGLLALAMGVLWFAGNTLNRVFIHVDLNKKIFFCYLSMFANSLLMIYFCQIEPFFAIGNIGMQIFLCSIIFPNFYARSVALFPNAAGVASALMGAFMILTVGLGSIVGALLQPDSLLQLSLTYLAINICLFGLYFSNVQFIFKKSSNLEGK